MAILFHIPAQVLKDFLLSINPKSTTLETTLMNKIIVSTLTPLFAVCSLSAQIVSENMDATITLNTDTIADDSTVGQFSTDIGAFTSSGPGGASINTNFDGDNAIAFEKNVEGDLTYAFDSTGLTGVLDVSFKLAVIDDGIQGVGDPLANPTMDFTMWGEVHPWNDVFTFDPWRRRWWRRSIRRFQPDLARGSGYRIGDDDNRR